MRLQKIVVLLFFVFFFSPSFAGWNGLSLLASCKEYEINRSSVYISNSDPGAVNKLDKIIKSSNCASYLSGVFDAYSQSSNRANRGQFCIPDNVTFPQKILVIIKYLNDHPEKLNSPAPLLINESLQEKFPC